MNWLKKLMAPKPSIEDLKLLALEKAKLPENLLWAKNYLRDSAIIGGDLELVPVGRHEDDWKQRVPFPAYKVLYKKRILGYLELHEQSDLPKAALVKNAQKFCPELFPVRIGDYFELKSDRLPRSEIVKIVDLFVNPKTNELSYILECVCSNSRQLMVHGMLVEYGTKISRVG